MTAQPDYTQRNICPIFPPNLGWLQMRLTPEEMDCLWSRINNPPEPEHSFKPQLAGNIAESIRITDKDGWFFNHAIIPNLFRYNYDLNIDVDLSKQICDKAEKAGLTVKMMNNPDFRIDYGTITTGHMFNPKWDKPMVVISSNRSSAYYSVDVMQEMMMELGKATREAILESGKKAVVLASNSLSHRHFTTESDVPEDMSREHITSHALYLWDMKVIQMMREGKTQEIHHLMPEFTEQAVSEADAGSFTWLLSSLGFPKYGAEIYGYGTVIGTGNVVAGWFPEEASA